MAWNTGLVQVVRAWRLSQVVRVTFPWAAALCSAAHKPRLSLSPTLSTMVITFTVEQLYGVYCEDSNAVWPAQWFLGTTIPFAVVATLSAQSWSGVAVSAILGEFCACRA